MNNFFDIQKKKLEIDEANARSRAKEVNVKLKDVELMLIFKEVEIMVADLSKMTPGKMVWFERRQTFMIDRDA